MINPPPPRPLHSFLSCVIDCMRSLLFQKPISKLLTVDFTAVPCLGALFRFFMS